MTVVGLFSGPGGWAEGLRPLGLPEVGLDVDSDACRTRHAAGHATIRADVARYPPDPFTGAVGLLASPPCQVWSSAGTRAAHRDLEHLFAAVERCRDGWVPDDHPWEDDSNRLMLEPLRWVATLHPPWVALEQVEDGLPLFRHMADVLRSWGYAADALRLHAEEFGLGQSRVRAVLLARLGGVLRYPVPTHRRWRRGEPPEGPECEPGLFGPGVLPWRSMADVLGWHGEVDRRADYVDGESTVAPRPSSWPAPTVTGTALRGQWVLRAPGEEDRRLTLAEATLLQGFRADYPWHGVEKSRFRQVGNAVPPPLAEAVARALVAP